MNVYKKWYSAFFLFLFITNGLWAESFMAASSKTVDKNDSTVCRFTILPEYKILHSTHDDDFKGADIVLSYKVSSSLYVGLGAEFTSSNLHNDNGWVLTNIKFVPLFADAKLFFLQNKTIAPFFQLSEGVSINNYSRKDNPQAAPYHVSELGDYLYAGFGCKFRLNKYITPMVGVGFNGFKMSFNEYDVNPHGITFRIGLLF